MKAHLFVNAAWSMIDGSKDDGVMCLNCRKFYSKRQRWISTCEAI